MIAVSRSALRKGLHAIFAEEPGGVDIVEAATQEELARLLENRSFDLIVIHQSLISDITALPRGKAAILATQPDVMTLSLAQRYGACAYLQEDDPEDIFLQLLHLPIGAFLTDQAVNSCVTEFLAHNVLVAMSDKGLTGREKEIFHLIMAGLDRHEIARHLNIAESTVRSHMSHIYESASMNRFQAKIWFALLERDKETER